MRLWVRLQASTLTVERNRVSLSMNGQSPNGVLNGARINVYNQTGTLPNGFLLDNGLAIV
jgi:hypothetical protein